MCSTERPSTRVELTQADVVVKGPLMNKWTSGLKQWSRWMVGEGGTPDRQAGFVLAATVAVVVVLGAGAAFALQNPATPKAGARKNPAVLAYRANIERLDHKDHRTREKSSKSAKYRKKSRSHNASNSKSKQYEKALGVALANQSAFKKAETQGTGNKRKGTHRKRDGTRAKHKGKAKDKAKHARQQAATRAAPSGTGQSFASPAVLPTPFIAPLVVTEHQVRQPGPPSAPVVNATGEDLGVELIWSPPTNSGGSYSGYNVYVGTRPGAEYLLPVNGSRLIARTSYFVPRLVPNTTYYFKVTAINASGQSAPSNEVAAAPSIGFQPVGPLFPPVVSIAADPSGSGYWLADSAGDVSTQGSARDYGMTTGISLNAPIIQIVSTPDGKGYWEVASDGGVFAFGNAPYDGSMGGKTLNAPIVGLASTANGRGYWEVASDGGVFAFGDARFAGSMGGRPVNGAVVGMALDPATGGYWEVTTNGAVYGFSASSLGGPSRSQLNAPVVAIQSAPQGKGYWVVSSDGGVYTYGSAGFHGSAASENLNAPVGGIAIDRATGGYWLFSMDGGTFAYGAPFLHTTT
jgi:hypothetical protein